MELMELLKRIAQQGITVVAVLHQPRFEVLQQCDDLLMLGEGGRTLYMGQASDAIDYFAKIGYPVPENFNPAGKFYFTFLLF